MKAKVLNPRRPKAGGHPKGAGKPGRPKKTAARKKTNPTYKNKIDVYYDTGVGLPKYLHSTTSYKTCKEAKQAFIDLLLTGRKKYPQTHKHIVKKFEDMGILKIDSNKIIARFSKR